MLHVLGIYENLKWPPPPVHGDIVDGNVNRVFTIGPFELVGRPFEFRRPVQRFGHVDNLALHDRFRRRFRNAQDRPRHIIGPIGRAAFATGIPGLHVDVLERLEADVLGAVDRLGNRGIHPSLSRGLHADVVKGSEGLGVHEVVRQVRIAVLVAPELHGIVDNFLFPLAAVLQEHLSGVAIGKNRFDPAGNVACKKADGAGRRD